MCVIGACGKCGIMGAAMDDMYECNLPEYLARDLEAWKKGAALFGV